MAQNQSTSPKISGKGIDIREELEKYLKYWPWFLLCVSIAMSFAYLKLTRSTPIYTTTATIIIKDGKNSQNSEMAAFSEMGLFNGMNSNSIQNEIGILRSRRLMAEVVKALHINVVYFDEERLRSSELYLNSPFLVKPLILDDNIKNSGASLNLIYLGNDKLKLIRTSDGKSFNAELGVPVDLGFGKVLVERNEFVTESNLREEHPILVKFIPVKKVANAYMKRLGVRIKENNSSLIELSLNDAVKSKAEDILDQLVMEYNREAIEDKNMIALNTARFIDERLTVINAELDSVEKGKVAFKEANELTDVQAESEFFMSSASEFKRNQRELNTQIELTNALLSYLESIDTPTLLPADLGIDESTVNTSISKYNDLVLEHNRVLRGSTEKNPMVIKLNKQIDDLRYNVVQSLNRLKENLKIAETSLNRESAIIRTNIASVPTKERQFRDIERQQKIKESLYLFLLQKREENSLSLSVTTPKAKIVDTAYSPDTPISPVPRNTYQTFLILGLALPFGFLYLRFLLNNKITKREDIEAITTDIPIIGEIPSLSNKEIDKVSENDRSALAESFRILHTNLQYLLAETKEKVKGNTIIVTSTLKGEGKTFVSYNLALTLSDSGKKVLLVGADLRNPQLQRYETDKQQSQGISDYLVNPELNIQTLISKSASNANMNILNSGTIPPNPSKLWRTKKTNQLFTELESLYDYIIVDTAPSLLVTDTFIINQYADLTLYVTRAGFTEKKLINFAVDSQRDGKLKNVSFVLNDVSSANFGYGNKYGYVYNEDKGFWNKLKDRVAFW